MPVDASIPLSVNQFDLGKVTSLADMMAQFDQRKQQQQGQLTLRNIFANPQNLDPATGMPNQQAMAQIMAVDPATGMKVMQNGIAMQGQKAQLEDHKMKRFATIQELVDPVRTSALAAHEDARKSGQSEEAAIEAGQRALNDGLTSIEQGGMLSDQEKQGLARKFDPMQFAARSRDWQVMQKEKAATSRAERAQTETERHNQAVEGGAGTAMDDGALDYAAETYRKTGQLPQLGSGAAGGAARAKIIARAAEQAKKTGGSGTADAEARLGEKQGAPLSDEAANLIAERMIAGDRQAAQGFARSPRNLAKIINTFTEKAAAKGMDGADIAARTAEFAGVLAGERALGNRTANIGMAVNEAKQFADLALERSAEVWRSKFVPVTAVLQAYEKGTNDPALRAFGAANLSFINAYARAVNPNGAPTVSDKDHAREMLDTVFDQKSYKAVIDQLQREMDAAIKSPGAVRQEFREAITGKAGEGNPAGTNAPAGRAFDTTKAAGMKKPGNVDPWNRPVLKNDDGSYSTTSSMSIGTDQGEVLIPTVVNGKRLSQDQAIARFRSTGENLGTFDTPQNADKYAEALHNAQAARYDDKGNPKGAAPKQEGDIYRDVTAAQYDVLPKGAHWTKPGDPPGKVRIKP